MKHLKQFKIFESEEINPDIINIQELLQEYIDEYDMYLLTNDDEVENGIFYYFMTPGIGNSVPDDMIKLVILMMGSFTEKYIEILSDMHKLCHRLKSAGYISELVEWEHNTEKTKIIDIYINI